MGCMARCNLENIFLSSVCEKLGPMSAYTDGGCKEICMNRSSSFGSFCHPRLDSVRKVVLQKLWFSGDERILFWLLCKALIATEADRSIR